jgi:AraC-like DNA-binding protein
MMNSPVLDDLDVLGRSDDLLRLTYSQLAAGSIAVETSVFALGGARICVQSANRSLGFRGVLTHRQAHFRLWRHQIGKVSASGATLAPWQVLIALPSEMVDVTVLGPSCSLGITLDLGLLAAALTPEAARALSAPPSTPRFIDVGEDLHAALWRLSHAALWSAPSSRPEDRGERIRCRLLALICELLNKTEPKAFPRSPVHDALDLMMDRLTEPLTLQDVCLACGRSKRSMIHHFTEALGISPMAYFKLQRLNAVRRALKAADPNTARVLDIAADYGFYHMGHFALEYRELFGVLPSVTLAAARLASGSDASNVRLAIV